MNPEQIGRYEVRTVAGSGGFATVYEGYDPRLDARVAIKVLADNWSRNPEVRRRFRQEAVLLRRLQSEHRVPGLVEVFDIDETDQGQPFFVMGWADRGSLADRVGERPWHPEQVRPIVEALTQSLGHLHAAGVVHRDIKPQNLLLRADHGAAAGQVGSLGLRERILVGDLGLAKDLTGDGSSLSLVAGTERYMAPEQLVFGGSIDHRADIYSATRMIEELMRGPNGSGSLSPGLERVLAKGAAFERDERHASMAEWRDELNEVLFPQAAATAAALPADPAELTDIGSVIDPIDRPSGEVIDHELAAASPPEVDVASDVTSDAAPVTSAREISAEQVPIDPTPDARSRTRPAPAPAGDSRGRSKSALILGAAVAVLALVAVGAALLLPRESDSPIMGPDTIESGEVATYRLDDVEAGAITWVDPAGVQSSGAELSITGRLPGRLDFSASVAGENYERSVEVVTAPGGPTIVGPETASNGETVQFRAEVQAGSTIVWIHPTEGEINAAEIEVVVGGQDFVVGLLSVGRDGIERGDQILVRVE